jgi:CheY-like chemotaxis protein
MARNPAGREFDVPSSGRTVAIDIAEDDMLDRIGRVMVIDDDEELRAVVVDFLDASGFDAVGFSDGREALRALRRRERTPAVILLDLEMPAMSGWEFRREQLRDPALAHIPVVIASGSDPLAVEADAYLAKPYATTELCRVLAALCVRASAA